jgi:aldehyde dehydrogenase (NAD+)
MFRHFIAGEWMDSVGGRTFESRNPADRRDVVGRFQQGTAADVAMAIKAAETALPMWKRTPGPKRGEILYAFGALMAQHKERLARAMTREMGKVIAEARGDVQEGIDIAYLMAGEGRRMAGETVPSELPDKWAMSVRQPLGIAGIITPWNFPMAIPCWKIMPALVTGNTVVFKPASDTPHCATLLVELMAEAGVPAGVVNLVTGTGAEVGDAIVGSPDIGVISFTGSSATGKSIATKAAGRLKRLSLELGGKNGIVVLADADVDLATDGILWSAFGTTGQRCTAASGHSSTPGRSTRSTPTSTSAEARASWCSAAAARGRATSTMATSSSRRSSAVSVRWIASARRRSSGRCCRSSRSTTTARRCLPSIRRVTVSPRASSRAT